MGGPRRVPAAMDVRNIGEALPTAQRHYRRAAKPPMKPMPSSLPSCFAEVWRRRLSPLAFDRRQRATLEAVASTIPDEAASLTAESAAAVYLAALVVSLQRLVSTTKAVRPATGADADRPLSKKARKKLRRQEREAEVAVKQMAAADALGSKKPNPDGSTPMTLEDSENDGVGAGVKEDTDDDVELIASLLSLIGMAVRGTSQAVLNTKCEPVLEAVMNAYDHVFGNSIVARLTSSVFAAILAVLDLLPWSKPLIQRSYLYLLRQTSDTDSRSRRRARDALDALLKSPRASIVRAKTSSAASAYFVSELKLQAITLDEVLNGDTVLEGPTSPATFVYLLTSVERFGVFLLPQDAAKVSKELVLISAKNLPNITTFALMALNAMFKHQVVIDDSDNDRPGADVFLPEADLGKLLSALLRHEPGKDGLEETILAYNSCIADGAIACASYYSFYPPPSEYLLQPVRILCNSIVPTGGRTDLTRNASTNLSSLLGQRWFKCRPEVLPMLQDFIGNGYRLVWPDMIPVLKRYLEHDMTSGALLMKKQVQRLVKILLSTRDKAVRNNDRKAQEMATAILSAIIRGGGVEHILSSCKVQYDKKWHVTNAWVLPILRDNVCGAPLALFTSQLLSVAEELKDAMKTTILQNRAVETKNMGIYVSQIWGLLPGFCNKPSDLGQDGVLTTAFKSIHFCLSAEDQASMCPVGVAALRQLSLSLASLDAEDPTTTGKRDSFGTRLKKLFPTIMTVAEVTTDDRRGSILEAVTRACQATNDSLLVSNLLRKSIRRLLELQIHRSRGEHSDSMVDEGDDTIRKQHATADVAIAIAESGIVPYDAAEIAFLEKAMSPFFLDGRQSSLQKKAYRATALLVGIGAVSKSPEELYSFATKMAEAGASVAPGAKAARQGLIVALVNQNLTLKGTGERMEFLKLLTELFLSEVVLSTRDMSEKTRCAAFETLVAIARGWNGSSMGNETTGLRQLFMAVAAGLGGKTVSMLSATLTSLGRLMYEFRGEATTNEELASDIDSLFASKVPEDSTNMEIAHDSKDTDQDAKHVLVQPGPVAILLRHSAFEVQKAALGVVKIATKALSEPSIRLVSVLPGILPGLVHVSARSKKQETRLRVRVILERLLRKCGREVLEANFPQDHLKLLSAVRKKYSRDLVKKHATKDRRRELTKLRDEQQRSLQEHAESEGEEDEFGIDDSDSDIERELLDGDKLLSSKRVGGVRGPNAVLVKEGEDDVMDLLDAKGSHSVLTQGDVKEASQRSRLEQKRKRHKQTEDVIKYTDDGRPIFVESDDDSGEADRGSMNDEDDSDLDDELQEKRSGRIRKRQRHDTQNGERHSKKVKGSFGEEYRGRKGFGDVKRAGRPDPFAYIPLGMNMLGANPRSGSLGSKKGRNASSLQRLRVMKESKKNNKKSGVPSKR